MARLAAVRLLLRRARSHLVLVAHCERLLDKAWAWPLWIVLVLSRELSPYRVRGISSSCCALNLLVARAFKCWLFSDPHVVLRLGLYQRRCALRLRLLAFLLLAREEEN